MPQIAAYPPAQVQPDAAGPPVQPPVLPGIAHVKYPGQVLRRDAHAAVPDAQIVSLPVDPDGPVLPGVLQGIAQQLLHHKGQPLAVRHRLPFHWRVIQCDAPVNELPGKPPHSGAHHIIHGARSYHVVAAALLQPQIGQCHIHILLHPAQLRHQPPGGRGVLTLQGQAHGGDGRLDLVHPCGVIGRHILPPGGARRLLPAQLPPQRLHHGGAVRPLHGGHGRQVQQHRLARLPQTLQRLVPPCRAAVIPRRKARPQQDAQPCRIAHRRQRQAVQGKGHSKHPDKQ